MIENRYRITIAKLGRDKCNEVCITIYSIHLALNNTDNDNQTNGSRQHFEGKISKNKSKSKINQFTEDPAA